MKHFLFRMVERAAGFSPASSPAPPRGFHWPVTSENSGPAPAARIRSDAVAGMHEFLTEPAIPAAPTGFQGEQQREIADDQRSQQPQAIAARQMDPVSLTSAADSVVPSLVVVTQTRRTRANSVTPDRAEENAAGVNQGLPPVASRLQPTRHDVQTADHEAAHNSQSRPVLMPEASVPAKRTPAKAITADAVLLTNFEDVQLVQPALSELKDFKTVFTLTPQVESPLPSQSRAPIYDSATRKEMAEPAVEVKIGRVEIQFDPPPASAVSSSTNRFASGFAEYAALRRYAVRPWPNNR